LSSAPLPALRDHALAEALDRVHDPLVGRSTPVGVPEAQRVSTPRTEWRRARDSNPQGPRRPVDFKFEPPPPSPCLQRSSLLLIMSLRGPLAGLKVQCRPMKNDGDSQEIAKQRGLQSQQARLELGRPPATYALRPRCGGTSPLEWGAVSQADSLGGGTIVLAVRARLGAGSGSSRRRVSTLTGRRGSAAVIICTSRSSSGPSARPCSRPA
jgi:hypothetical protein